MLVLRVSDDGVGMSPAKLAGGAGPAAPGSHPHGEGLAGYGIHNVHERIQLSFGTALRAALRKLPGPGHDGGDPASAGQLPEDVKPMWKVLIADDEPKIRRGLRTTIERARPDMKVVAEAEDGEMALALARAGAAGHPA